MTSATMNENAKLIIPGVLQGVVEEFIGAVVDIVLAFPDALYTITDALSNDWDMPKIFNDDLDIFGEVAANPWFTDLYIDGSSSGEWYSLENLKGIVFDLNGSDFIEGHEIGQKSALLTVSIVIGAVASYFGILKIKTITKVILGRIFGRQVKRLAKDIKADTEDLKDSMEILLTGDDIDTEPVEALAMNDDVKSQLEKILYRLERADADVSGLIQALLMNRSVHLVDEEWKDGEPEPVVSGDV